MTQVALLSASILYLESVSWLLWLEVRGTQEGHTDFLSFGCTWRDGVVRVPGGKDVEEQHLGMQMSIQMVKRIVMLRNIKMEPASDMAVALSGL